jgi:hypothetical protein
MLNQLTSLLNSTNEDYWHDEASGRARAILNAASQAQLIAIQDSWGKWSPTWQERLAYVLGESGQSIEMDILRGMAKSENKDVALVARESLNSIQSRTRSNESQRTSGHE